MQFTRPYKEAIRAGRIDASFRNWKKPQAKVGGRYNLHNYGAIEVTQIRQIKLSDAPAATVKRAGFDNVKSLQNELGVRMNQYVYLVEFKYLGDIKVKKPPKTRLTAAEYTQMVDRLKRVDERSSRGPWAFATLGLINEYPGRRAADLAELLGWQTTPFKANVRRLKQLGLTESLEVGYRLSTRGKGLFEQHVAEQKQ